MLEGAISFFRLNNRTSLLQDTLFPSTRGPSLSVTVVSLARTDIYHDIYVYTDNNFFAEAGPDMRPSSAIGHQPLQVTVAGLKGEDAEMRLVLIKMFQPSW